MCYIDKNVKNKIIIVLIINLVYELELWVMVEGVEIWVEYDIIVYMGCDEL